MGFINFSCRNNQFLPVLTFNNSIVPKVEWHRHLGLILTEDLSWRNHINSVLASGNKKLGIWKKCSYDLTRIQKIKLYLNYIRPTVEFGNVIYNNCCVADSIKLDQLQRKAAVICTGVMTLTKTCHLMCQLNWESLKIRRDLASLNIIYRYIIFIIIYQYKYYIPI